MSDSVKQGTIVHFLANVDGGVWSVVKNLAACQRDRWRVTLVAMHQGPMRPAFAEEAEQCFDAVYVVRRPKVTGIYYLAPVSVRAAIETLGVDTKAENVIYHFHTGPYTPWVYRLPRRRRSGNWLATFHGSRGSFGDSHSALKRWLYIAGVRRLLKEQFHLVAVSDRSARDCAAMYGRRAGDFEVVYNGASTSNGKDRPPREGPHRPLCVGFVGQVMPAKGWQKVVEAVQRLRREGQEVVCVIAGGGPELGKLKRLAARHSQWLVAPGHVASPAADVFPAIDVLVLPSDFEGHPLVVLEAMASGVPCICSDVGGCAETVVHDQQGYILRKNSVEEIATYIKRILTGEGAWSRLSRNCVRRHQQMFTAEAMAASWERIYGRGLREDRTPESSISEMAIAGRDP